MRQKVASKALEIPLEAQGTGVTGALQHFWLPGWEGNQPWAGSLTKQTVLTNVQSSLPLIQLKTLPRRFSPSLSPACLETRSAGKRMHLFEEVRKGFDSGREFALRPEPCCAPDRLPLAVHYGWPESTTHALVGTSLPMSAFG